MTRRKSTEVRDSVRGSPWELRKVRVKGSPGQSADQRSGGPWSVRRKPRRLAGQQQALPHESGRENNCQLSS